MDKKLRAYREYIAAEYKKLDKKSAPKELIELHLAMVEHFQHERFIHLVVTVSFAMLMLLCFMGFIALCLVDGAAGLSYCVGGVALILFVTTLFYVRHYYLLENGTEELEDMTRKLYGRDFFKEK